ncbi:hypothetical protein AYI69_g1452 [Smittium culicis]|uniref:Uncharacterized protein n=1 Tax=Smittium culicis TaxID=133412 RepID=A0A1R1YQ81_9FUNG|nr:hypothetical protein AYI69_g1452 [Smittium culicis]
MKSSKFSRHGEFADIHDLNHVDAVPKRCVPTNKILFLSNSNVFGLPQKKISMLEMKEVYSDTLPLNLAESGSLIRFVRLGPAC